MAIPLRVVQFYRMVGKERLWEGYELQVKTKEGWVPFPVVMQEVTEPQGNMAKMGQV